MTKEKLEKDYQNFKIQIDQLSEEAIKNFREKAKALSEEAKEIGEKVAVSLDKGS
jgi:hypothetical protein